MRDGARTRDLQSHNLTCYPTALLPPYIGGNYWIRTSDTDFADRCLSQLDEVAILEQDTRFELALSVWKTDVLAADTNPAYITCFPLVGSSVFIQCF